MEGLFTHFATADWTDQTFVLGQLADFNAVVAALQANQIRIPIVHAANSAATMRLPEAHFNAVRIGIAMYGLDPSDEWSPVFEIQPALSLKSRVSRVQRATCRGRYQLWANCHHGETNSGCSGACWIWRWFPSNSFQ